MLAGLLLSGAAWAQSAMPVMELTAGIHRIEAEVAANDQNRQVGLMNRKTMPPQRGMLFVFPQNTALHVDAQYAAAALGRLHRRRRHIINIEDMQPQTEDNHCAKVPARYALEMNDRLVCPARHQARAQAERHRQGAASAVMKRSKWRHALLRRSAPIRCVPG
jgi:uncharacterized membrane protein (UPF0127 family)